MLVFDQATLKKIGEVPLDGHGDSIAFDAKNRKLYVDEDDGKQIWVIDAKALKVVQNIPIEGPPETIEYDAGTDRLYQNIKTTNHVQAIYPKSGAIVFTWSTLPVTSPHGLAIFRKNKLLLISGTHGQLVAMNMTTGAVVGASDCNPCDQIVFDPWAHRVYTAGGGLISVVNIASEGPSLLENVPVAKSAHTITVDGRTHEVWISYSQDGKSYFQSFSPIMK